jgi:hypothetical protein
MAIKIIQTVAVVGAAGLAIACVLANCWLPALSFMGLSWYIGWQDSEDECDDDEE